MAQQQSVLRSGSHKQSSHSTLNNRYTHLWLSHNSKEDAENPENMQGGAARMVQGLEVKCAEWSLVFKEGKAKRRHESLSEEDGGI